MRSTARTSRRSFSSSSTTFSEMTRSGPRMKTLGRSCSRIAASVGAGIESRLTGSTASPERAAQAAAGMAHSALSPE